MKEAPRQTIRRRPDEPRLEIGQTISVEEGAAVVLARYVPPGRKEVRYIVEVLPRHRSNSRSAGAG